MFPQGALESQHEHHPRFEKGLEVVLRNLDDSVQVIFNLNLTDFFARINQIAVNINQRKAKETR